MELCQVPDRAGAADVSRLFAEHGNALLRFCYLQLGDAHLAQDAVQETFLRAHRRRASFRGECGEKTWLTAIALNCCRDIRRRAWFRRERFSPALSDLPEPSEPFDPGDDTVITQVMALPLKYREAILLHYYQGLSVRDIALATGTSENTWSTRLRRARSILKNKLERWYFDEEDL